MESKNDQHIGDPKPGPSSSIEEATDGSPAERQCEQENQKGTHDNFALQSKVTNFCEIQLINVFNMPKLS